MKTTDLPEVAASTDIPPAQTGIETLPTTETDQPVQSPYKRKRLQFIAAVACQLLILTGLASVKAYTLACGTTVALETKPVDPRDMFRGDYVRLNYDISIVPTEKNFQTGDQVFVVLRKGAQYWTSEDVVAKVEQVPPSAVAIKGKVEWQESTDTGRPLNKLHMHYGIEQAFVPEGTGHNLEVKKSLTVLVAVDRFGNSVVKNVNSQ